MNYAPQDNQDNKALPTAPFLPRPFGTVAKAALILASATLFFVGVASLTFSILMVANDVNVDDWVTSSSRDQGQSNRASTPHFPNDPYGTGGTQDSRGTDNPDPTDDFWYDDSSDIADTAFESTMLLPEQPPESGEYGVGLATVAYCTRPGEVSWVVTSTPSTSCPFAWMVANEIAGTSLHDLPATITVTITANAPSVTLECGPWADSDGDAVVRCQSTSGDVIYVYP